MIWSKFYSTSSLALIMIIIAGCQTEELIRTNPFDADYDVETGVGNIVGYGALDQRSDRANIFVELRASSEVPTSYSDIANRNDIVPEGWSDLMTIPSLGSGGSNTTTTGEGKYTFDNVPVGHYVLRVSKAGFNTVWLTNIEIIKDGTIRIPGTTVLTEQVEGKILFISQRDGFAEFYQMESDGTQQERLTFDGIVGSKDDDIDFTAIDFDPDIRKAVFVADGKIFILDYGTNSTQLLDIQTNVDFYSAEDVAWGPNGSLYFLGNVDFIPGIFKIEDINNPAPVVIVEEEPGNFLGSLVGSFDISGTGQIVYVRTAYVYLFSDGLLYSEHPSLNITKIDENGQLLYTGVSIWELPEEDRVPELIRISQILVKESDVADPQVVYTGDYLHFTYPIVSHDDEEFFAYRSVGHGYDLLEIINNETGQTTVYAVQLAQLLIDLNIFNLKWGVEWSPDGQRITFCDFFGSAMAMWREEIFPDPPVSFSEIDYFDRSTFSSSELSQEWNYFFNVNTVTYNPDSLASSSDPFVAYLGYEEGFTYAYDSFLGYGTAQPTWSAPNGEKIVFVKGKPGEGIFYPIYRTKAWTDLDIWSMDADNSVGEGPLKQLTTNPNKDFLPIWVP